MASIARPEDVESAAAMDKVYSKLLSRVQGLSQGSESLSQSGTHPHRLALELAQALSVLGKLAPPPIEDLSTEPDNDGPGWYHRCLEELQRIEARTKKALALLLQQFTVLTYTACAELQKYIWQQLLPNVFQHSLACTAPTHSKLLMDVRAAAIRVSDAVNEETLPYLGDLDKLPAKDRVANQAFDAFAPVMLQTATQVLLSSDDRWDDWLGFGARDKLFGAIYEISDCSLRGRAALRKYLTAVEMGRMWFQWFDYGLAHDSLILAFALRPKSIGKQSTSSYNAAMHQYWSAFFSHMVEESDQTEAAAALSAELAARFLTTEKSEWHLIMPYCIRKVGLLNVDKPQHLIADQVQWLRSGKWQVIPTSDDGTTISDIQLDSFTCNFGLYNSGTQFGIERVGMVMAMLDLRKVVRVEIESRQEPRVTFHLDPSPESESRRLILKWPDLALEKIDDVPTAVRMGCSQSELQHFRKALAVRDVLIVEDSAHGPKKTASGRQTGAALIPPELEVPKYPRNKLRPKSSLTDSLIEAVVDSKSPTDSPPNRADHAVDAYDAALEEAVQEADHASQFFEGADFGLQAHDDGQSVAEDADAAAKTRYVADDQNKNQEEAVRPPEQRGASRAVTAATLPAARGGLDSEAVQRRRQPPRRGKTASSLAAPEERTDEIAAGRQTVEEISELPEQLEGSLKERSPIKVKAKYGSKHYGANDEEQNESSESSSLSSAEQPPRPKRWSAARKSAGSETQHKLAVEESEVEDERAHPRGRQTRKSAPKPRQLSRKQSPHRATDDDDTETQAVADETAPQKQLWHRGFGDTAAKMTKMPDWLSDKSKKRISRTADEERAIVEGEARGELVEEEGPEEETANAKLQGPNLKRADTPPQSLPETFDDIAVEFEDTRPEMLNFSAPPLLEKVSTPRAQSKGSEKRTDERAKEHSSPRQVPVQAKDQNLAETNVKQRQSDLQSGSDGLPLQHHDPSAVNAALVSHEAPPLSIVPEDKAPRLQEESVGEARSVEEQVEAEMQDLAKRVEEVESQQNIEGDGVDLPAPSAALIRKEEGVADEEVLVLDPKEKRAILKARQRKAKGRDSGIELPEAADVSEQRRGDFEEAPKQAAKTVKRAEAPIQQQSVPAPKKVRLSDTVSEAAAPKGRALPMPVGSQRGNSRKPAMPINVAQHEREDEKDDGEESLQGTPAVLEHLMGKAHRTFTNLLEGEPSDEEADDDTALYVKSAKTLRYQDAALKLKRYQEQVEELARRNEEKSQARRAAAITSKATRHLDSFQDGLAQVVSLLDGIAGQQDVFKRWIEKVHR